MFLMSVTISVNQATFTFLPTLPLNTLFYHHWFVQDKASNTQHHTYELGTQMNLSSSPTSPFPLLLPPSLFLSIPAPSVFPFSLMLSQAAVLFWVTVSDAQVTKAQRCPVSTLPSVSSVLRQMLAEAEVATQCLEQTALGIL